MHFIGYTKEIAALLSAYVLFAAPKRMRISRWLAAAFAGAIAVGLLWGVNDPFYLDGIQTIGRSHMLYDGDFEGMRRLSLTYAVLGFLLRYIANENWMGHLYIIGCTLVLLYGLSRSVRHPGLRVLAVLMGLASPYVFMLSKWVTLDIPVIAGATITILVFDWAVRKPVFARFATAFLCLVITCLLKEPGALIFVPLLFLPLMAPRGNRLRVLSYVIGSILLSSVITYVLCSFHAQAHSDKDEANWVLFNPEYGSPMVTDKWFAYSVRENLQAVIWWGYFFFALIGFAKPRNKVGLIILAVIIICQLAAVISIGQFEMRRDWLYGPLAEPSRLWIPTMAVFAVIILGAGYAFRLLSWQRPSRLEWLSLIFLASVVFFFGAAGKVNTRSDGSIEMVMDWRYIAIAVPMLVVLAIRSIGRLFGRSNPAWFRGLVAGTVALTLLLNFVRSADLAVFSGEKARAVDEAYQACVAQPARVVYSHWPFFHMSGRFDYGSLKWKTSGFQLKQISTLPLLKKMPGKKRPKAPAILIHNSDYYKKIPSKKWFPESLHDEPIEAYYLQPIGPDVKKKRIGSNYVATVQL